jgi:hypothetical protein
MNNRKYGIDMLEFNLRQHEGDALIIGYTASLFLP